MEETTYFNQGNVWVTNARFIVHTQTYAMNGVTSVKQAVNMPSRFGPIVLILLGLLLSLGGAKVAIVIGLPLVGLGIFWWIKQKPTWIVVLSSSSGEHRALASQDRKFIQGVVDALNSAIVGRG